MPASRVRMAWNLIVFFLLMYTATLVPYRTVFIEEEDSTSLFFYFDIVVDILYFLDLIFNFFMAYEDGDKKLETRLKFISRSYLGSWFTLDLISCIPF